MVMLVGCGFFWGGEGGLGGLGVGEEGLKLELKGSGSGSGGGGICVMGM